MDVELARVWAREEGVRSLTGRVVLADGQVVEASSADLHNYALAEEPGGPREVVLVVDRPSLGLRCEHHAVRYPGSLAEYWQVVRNIGDRPVTLRRVESGRVLLRRSRAGRDVFSRRLGLGVRAGAREVGGELRAGADARAILQRAASLGRAPGAYQELLGGRGMVGQLGAQGT